MINVCKMRRADRKNWFCGLVEDVVFEETGTLKSNSS